MFKKLILSMAFTLCLLGSNILPNTIDAQVSLAANPKIEKKTLDFFKAVEKEKFQTATTTVPRSLRGYFDESPLRLPRYVVKMSDKRTDFERWIKNGGK